MRLPSYLHRPAEVQLRRRIQITSVSIVTRLLAGRPGHPGYIQIFKTGKSFLYFPLDLD